MDACKGDESLKNPTGYRVREITSTKKRDGRRDQESSSKRMKKTYTVQKTREDAIGLVRLSEGGERGMWTKGVLPLEKKSHLWYDPRERKRIGNTSHWN